MTRAFLLGLLVSFSAVGSLSADQPDSRFPWFASSERGEYCLKLVPEKYHVEGNRVIQDRDAFVVEYSLDEDGGLKEKWRGDGWFYSSGYLSDDGLFFVGIGPWASDKDRHTDVAVSFYQQGKLIRSYQVKDLIKDPSKLEHSVSHYQWRPVKQSVPTGFDRGSNLSVFHLVMVDKTAYDFDYTSGQIIKTDVDKGALSELELFELASKEEERQGLAMLDASPKKAEFAKMFTFSNVRLFEGTISSVYFKGPDWSATLRPKEKLERDCEVNVVFPVTSIRQIDMGLSAADLMFALRTALAHPFVEDRFAKHGATGMRFWVAGDRLHWKTEDLQGKLRKLNLAPSSEEILHSWLELVIDNKAQRQTSTSLLLNVKTGDIIYTPADDRPRKGGVDPFDLGNEASKMPVLIGPDGRQK